MADINAKDILIGLAMATFFIIGGVSLLGEFANENSAYLNNENISTFNNTFNRYDQLSSGVSNMQGKVSGSNATSGIGENTDTFQNNIILQGWTALTSIGSLFSFAFSATGGLFSGLSSMLGIPVWVTSFITLLMIILLIWAVLSLILRRW